MATSISLPYDTVLRILEEWLNANELRQPHDVVDLDYIDTSGGAINIGLRARHPIDGGGCPGFEPTFTVPAAAVTVAVPEAVALPYHVIPAPLNGNGHVVTAVTPPQEDAQAPAAEKRKSGRGGQPKLTDDQRFEIYRIRTEYGTSAKDLAARYQVSEATIYAVIAEARAEEQKHRSSPQEPAGDL